MRRAAVLVKIMEKASGPALVGVGALFSSPAVELIAKSETPPFYYYIFLKPRGSCSQLDGALERAGTQPSP